MKTNILKSALFILLIAAFGKMKAQNDPLFTDLETYPESKSNITMTQDEKIKIGNIIQNPASNNTLVRINCASSVTLKVKIFKMNGDIAKEEVHALERGDNELILNEEDLNSGTYVVQFYTSEGSALRRYVKMH